MYSHVACDVMKERTLYLLKPSSLIWHLMPYLFLLNTLCIWLTNIWGPANKTVLYPNLCYNEVCDKGTADAWLSEFSFSAH